MFNDLITEIGVASCYIVTTNQTQPVAGASIINRNEQVFASPGHILFLDKFLPGFGDELLCKLFQIERPLDRVGYIVELRLIFQNMMDIS